MKKILFILASVISLNCFAQDKIVKIPQSELDAFFLAVDTLQYQDSIKTILISDLELQLVEYKTLSLQNDTLLKLKSDKIILFIQAMKNHLKKWCLIS